MHSALLVYKKIKSVYSDSNKACVFCHCCEIMHFKNCNALNICILFSAYEDNACTLSMNASDCRIAKKMITQKYVYKS